MTLLQELEQEFPDIEEADIVRVLLYIGFTADDLNKSKNVQQIKFDQIIVPWSAVWHESKIAEQEHQNKKAGIEMFRAEMNRLIDKMFEV